MICFPERQNHTVDSRKLQVHSLRLRNIPIPYLVRSRWGVQLGARDLRGTRKGTHCRALRVSLPRIEPGEAECSGSIAEENVAFGALLP